MIYSSNIYIVTLLPPASLKVNSQLSSRVKRGDLY